VYVRQTLRHFLRDWPEEGPLEPEHVANYVLMTIYVLCLAE